MLRTDSFDLGALNMRAGEGRRFELRVPIDPYQLGGERYAVPGAFVDVRLDVSRTIGAGYALRLRFEAELRGPCMRCLEDAAPRYAIDAREVSQPGFGEELSSPYVEHGVLDLRSWAHDALALALPAALLCRPDCAGLCPDCGIDLNRAPAGHHHQTGPDPRFAKLSELRFD